MTSEGQKLLVGLGSPWGDDQLGWRVVEEVERQHDRSVVVRRAQAASELLDWLDGVERLTICDACQGAGPVGSWHRWRWPSKQLPPMRSTGSHDLGLAEVLALAKKMGQLPERVTIWAIEGQPPSSYGVGPDAPLSSNVHHVVPQVAALISGELSLA